MPQKRTRKQSSGPRVNTLDVSLIVLTIILLGVGSIRYGFIVNERAELENETRKLERKISEAKYKAELLDIDYQTRKEERLKAFDKSDFQPMEDSDYIK